MYNIELLKWMPGTGATKKIRNGRFAIEKTCVGWFFENKRLGKKVNELAGLHMHSLWNIQSTCF